MNSIYPKGHVQHMPDRSNSIPEHKLLRLLLICIYVREKEIQALRKEYLRLKEINNKLKQGI